MSKVEFEVLTDGDPCDIDRVPALCRLVTYKGHLYARDFDGVSWVAVSENARPPFIQSFSEVQPCKVNSIKCNRVDKTPRKYKAEILDLRKRINAMVETAREFANDWLDDGQSEFDPYELLSVICNIAEGRKPLG